MDGRGDNAGRSIAATAGGSRLAEYALASAVFLGSFALWVVVPFGCLWLSSHVSDNATTVMLTALVVTPLAMLACGLGLSALYGAYLRVANGRAPVGKSAWLGSLSGDRRRTHRPVLDFSLTFSAIAAIVLLLVWFLFVAERPIPLP